MKKMIILVCTFLFTFSGINSIAYSEVETDTNHIFEEITFSQPTFSQKGHNAIIQIDAINGFIIEPGKPLLPAYEQTYIFPFGTKIEKISCNIKESQFTSIDSDIEYIPMPVRSIDQYSEVSEVKTVDDDLSVYPEKWYNYRVGTGIQGLQRKVFVTLSIYPVKYHPEINKVEYIDKATIDIEYTNQNVGFFSNDEQFDLLILTAPEFSEELVPLVNHKIQTKNLSTKLVTTTEIYAGTYFEAMGRDKPENIKYFIKNAIEQWDTKYVMFVGGAEQFPTRDTHVFVDYQDGDDEIFVSDLYYADIYDADGNFSSWDSNENDIFGEYNWTEKYDDVDLYPDVHFGRLAATNSNAVEAIVNKITIYETSEAWTKNWFNTMVVIGGDTFTNIHGDESGINEGEYLNQAGLDHMVGFIPYKIWASNGRLGGISPSGVEEINNAIENGCGFLDWAGHGSTNVWTTYPHNGSRQSLPSPWGSYYNYHVMNLKNEHKLPIVVTGACSVGKFNTNPDCFTWSFVKNPDGGGIGAFGGSGLVWGYIGPWTTIGLSGKFHVGYYKAFAEGAYTFGELHTGALIDYISANMDSGDHKTIRQFIPFGDPSLMIRDESLPPEKPIVVGNQSGAINEEYTYVATTTDSDGDKVSFIFDWGDGSYSSWIGPVESGSEVKASYVWEEEGDYEVRVLARNVRGVQSEWSDTLPVTMPYQRPFFLNQLIERIVENLPFLHFFFQKAR